MNNEEAIELSHYPGGRPYHQVIINIYIIIIFIINIIIIICLVPVKQKELKAVQAKFLLHPEGIFPLK